MSYKLTFQIIGEKNRPELYIKFAKEFEDDVPIEIACYKFWLEVASAFHFVPTVGPPKPGGMLKELVEG